MDDPLTDMQARIVSAVLDGEHRIVLLPGGAGSGKTWGAVLGLALHCRKYPRALCLVAGQSVDTVRRNVEPALAHWSALFGLPYRYHASPPAYSVGSAHWEVRGLADAVSYTRIQGRTYHGVMVDELSTIHESSWDMILTRLRTEGAKAIATFNKLSPHHWTKTRVVDKAAELRAVVLESRLTDNPHLAGDFVSSMLEGGGLARHQYQRLVENQWAAPEGLVYPYWHYAESEGPPGPVVAGADYGESGVSAAVYLRRTPDGYNVVGEYYWDARHRGYRDAAGHAGGILQGAPGALAGVYYDPSAVSLGEALRRAGTVALPGWNDKRGYDITNDHLQSGRVKLVERAVPALLTEMEQLIYNSRLDMPDPSCIDHATDALRYVVCGIADTLAAKTGPVVYAGA